MSPATLSLRVVTPADPYDAYEPFEVFIQSDVLRRAQDIAEANGSNVGDWLCDLLLAALEGQVASC